MADAPAAKRLKTDDLPSCCADAASAASALHAHCLRSLSAKRVKQQEQSVKQRKRNANAFSTMLLRMCSSPRAAVVGTEHFACVQAIIDGGFAADWASGIRAAAVHSHLPALKALIASAPSDQLSRLAQTAIASSCDTAVKDAKQRSALQGFIDYALAQFIAAGGNLQADITAGRTLLHQSVLKGSGGSTVVRRALLAATAEAASTQQQQQCCLLAQQDGSGCTALHAAVGASTASWHNTKALKDLLSHSSAAAVTEALSKQDKDGRSVLHYAVSKSSDAGGSLQKLLSKCKELGVLTSVLRIRDYSGADAVGHARRYGRAAVLSLLQQMR
jgi:hypothetical protein